MAFYKGYKGADVCTGTPQTGSRGFMSWFLAKFSSIGGQNSGIYNCRPIRGSKKTTSLHGEGRAVDLGLKFARKEFGQLADLLRRYSAELGIQCVIYNRKIFAGSYASPEWQKYNGVNPHTDHLHVELSWWAAELSAAEYIELLENTIGDKLGDKYEEEKPGNVGPTGKPSTSGGSIVDYLATKGMDSSFKARAKLAAQNGISGYKGTAQQNIDLLNKLKNKTPSKPAEPSKPNKPAPKPPTSGYKGYSLVEYLKSVGKNPSYSNREVLAKQYGIKDYKGTAQQNTLLLLKLRNAKPAKPSTKKVTGSIVDYLNSKGQDSSFKARAVLAKKYGIHNYEGTSPQNEKLLSKIQD